LRLFQEAFVKSCWQRQCSAAQCRAVQCSGPVEPGPIHFAEHPQRRIAKSS